MTDLEKKAREWTRKTDNHLNEEKTHFLSETEYAEKAYIAGAKENGVEWHDLRKEPNDLPKVKEGKTSGGMPYHISNVVQNQKGQHCWYNYKYNKWCDNDYILDEVIAWCEIPQFKV